jgi:hypothetical protein
MASLPSSSSTPQGNIIANDIRGPEIEDALSKIKF